MADRFWKSMPSALKKPTLDELYRRLRDLDYTQVDERMAVMLNAILQLEEQGECRDPATEAVLMVGYTTDGISNQEQTRWLSWNVDGAIRGFDLARNPGLSNNTEYGAGEFPLPVRSSVRSTGQSTSKTPLMSRAQQTGEAYPDVSIMKRELERTQRERNKANLDRDQAKLEGDQAKLETQVIRPLMDVALPGYTPSSTPGSSQVSGSSLRLKELHERLQLRSRESPARVELPSTWGEQPVRSVVISSYKKNTEGRYHRHNRMDWSTAQRDRRDCFHDAAWVEYLTQPRVPEGAVHLIIGDRLLRVLTRIQSHWQTGILSFAGAATPQMLATLEMLGMARVYTVTLMVGTNDVSRGEARKVTRLHDKMSCILEELRIQMDPAILTVCTIPYNMKADQHAMEMNTKSET